MNFICMNISSEYSSLMKRYFRVLALKRVAYSATYDLAGVGGTMRTFYDYVLVPVKEYDPSDPVKVATVKRYVNLLSRKFVNQTNLTRTIIYSVGKLLEETITKEVSLESFCDKDFTFDVLTEIEDKDIGIIYTDGSINKTTNEGGFGIVKIVDESTPEQIFDEISNRYRNYQTFSEGGIANATNEISEISGYKYAAGLIDKSKPYWILLCDNETAVKNCREYIYDWRINNYCKKGTNKPILNMELVKATDQALSAASRDNEVTIFFKWLKGHDSQECNETCDKLAKAACGVK